MARITDKRMTNLNLYLGCAVWSYSGWVGNFYPMKTKPQDFLHIYSQQFNTVEGNTTFYAIPQPKTIRKWTEETTARFKFCPKFPKTITHQGLLEPKIDRALNFCQIISGLENKLGIIFAQLPPNYSPQYIEDLKCFLQAIKSYNIALEVRHPDWFISPFKEQLNELLIELNIARVLLDTRPIYNCQTGAFSNCGNRSGVALQNDPQINSRRRKPNVPLEPIVTNQYAFVRFISHPEIEYNRAYLNEWAKQVSKWLTADITVYFFVHCPLEEKSPKTANYFKDLLATEGVVTDSITTNKIEKPIQLNLFES